MVTVEDKIEDAEEGLFFKKYWQFLSSKWGKYIIVLFWIGILILGVFYGFKFLSLTVFEFSAPNGTDGAIAQDMYNEKFDDQSNIRTLVILYQCNSCNNTCKNGTTYEFNIPTNVSAYVNNATNFTLNSKVYPFSIQNNTQYKYISGNMSIWLEQRGDIVFNYLDYYTAINYVNGSYNGSDEAVLVQTKLATDVYINDAMTYAVGVVQYQNGKSQKDKYDLIDDLYDYTNEVSNDVITVSMTGQAALIKDMNEESKKDVEKKDVITIPIALCVLAIIVRSWRLMFIPILTFGISICASFSIMRPFTNVLDVSPFAPSIMMSVSIAMSIDYSLFLLTRYREEVENRMKNVLAMNIQNNIKIAIIATKQTTRWSGKVVCLSGAILASTYLCLVAYPLSALQSMGLGASIAILCTILVNMTLTPSLLLIFPVFFSQFGANGCGCWRRKKQNNGFGYSDLDDDDDGLTNGHNNNENNDNNNNDINNNYPTMLSANSPASNNNHINKPFSISEEITLEQEAKNANPIDRCWYICGMKSTLWPVSLILCIVVYALISTVGWKVLDIKKQLADTLIFPRDSPYLTTFNEVSDNFNPGLTAPWQILITSNTSKVTTPQFIDQSGITMHKFWTTLIKNDYQNSIIGPAFFGIGPSIVDAFVFPSAVIDKIMDNAAINQSYEYITNSKINSDESAVFYTMTTAFDPYYENAIEFVADAREYLSEACNYPEQKPNPVQYDCYLLGGSVAEVDSVNKTFGSFPWVLAIIICSVFTVMGFVFRSAFVPFRLLITIIYPMTFVYGLAIFVYQDGIFDGIGWEPIKGTDGLYWLIPVMTVTILVGLALDYDIFLFARIYEYRVIGGVPTRDAIVRGVFKTGSIITAAGIIMAIAFCGLMLSNITSLNQTGFILVVAVLVDTFVIRTSLVPAVLSMAKEVNWWPGSNRVCRKSNESENIMPMNSKNFGIEYDVQKNDNNNMAQPIIDDTM